MGYDNNKPLTGVTGGGLPAEIWRETMAAIHEDMPAKPLPMLRPTETFEGRYFGQDAPPPETQQREDPVLIQILRDLLGG
jgi:membrane peptidoglycan carboxypeptidase